MTDSPFESPTGTREEILAATYRALCAHGYADLTLATIGDEFEKSQSLVYHHYDGKDDLVLACLEFMLEYFESTLDETTIDEPRDALERTLGRVCEPEPTESQRSFRRAIVELRAQAAHDPAYREHFTRSDQLFRDRLCAIIEVGIESETFRDCDPARVTSLLLATLQGVFFRWTTVTTTEWVPEAHDELVAYLEQNVYASTD